MKTALLVASVMLNALLLGLFFLSRETRQLNSPPPSATAPSTSPASTKQSGPASSSDPAAVLRANWGKNSVETAQLLLESGAPPALVTAIVEVLMRREYSQRRAQLLYPNGINRWSPTAHLTGQIMADLSDLSRERREAVRKVMGADFDLALLVEDPFRKVKWGDLNPGEFLGVNRITEDYRGGPSKVNYGANYTTAGFRAEIALDAEFERDIRSALSPAKADDFLLYNSLLATSLQQRLSQAGVEVDESHYRALYAGTQDLRESSVREAAAGAPAVSPFEWGLKELRMFQTTLGDEDALRMTTYRYEQLTQLDALLVEAGAIPAVRIAVSAESLTGFAAIEAANTLRASDPSRGEALVKSEAVKLYDSLTSRLPATQRAKFDSTMAGKSLLLRLKSSR